MKKGARPLILFTILFLITTLLAISLLYNLSGANFFSQRSGQYLSFFPLFLFLFQGIWALASLFRNVNGKHWKRAAIWALFSALAILGLIAAFFLSMLYFGLIGNYADG